VSELGRSGEARADDIGRTEEAEEVDQLQLRNVAEEIVKNYL
jgi:hypothetical protein